MRLFSIIIPVYNRPDEVAELLESLTEQDYESFEVLVVEDGSTKDCRSVVEKFKDQLAVTYFYKENTGQGFSRNFGFQRAKGDYFIVYDSDCLIPSGYLSKVNHFLNDNYLDAYGGPDKDHPDFTYMQKAISYSMTGLFTTGGIRGGEKRIGNFQPRGFNMGISREVFEKTKGYKMTRMGEDIEYSIRILSHGFKVGLIPEAFVYHKRRTNLKQFFKQALSFGRGRVFIQKYFPKEIKLVHTFPLVFLVGFVTNFVLLLIYPNIFQWTSYLIALYFGLILVDATVKQRSFVIGIMSVATSFTQLIAYGLGFIKEGFIRLKDLKK